MERRRVACPVTVDPDINQSFVSHVLMAIVNATSVSRVSLVPRGHRRRRHRRSGPVRFDGGNQRRVKPLGRRSMHLL